MIKFISIAVLSACLFTATFSKWLLIAAFELNKNYISTTLCINRENKNLHCNGHCFLREQISKEEKSKSSTNGRSDEKFQIQLFFCEEKNIFLNHTFILNTYSPQQNDFAKQQFYAEHFHPPA